MKRLIFIAFLAIGLTSCSKEHEFIGTWEAVQEIPGVVTKHQISFNKDNTASYCLIINNLEPTCQDGEFTVPEKGKLMAHFGTTNLTRFTFHPTKKNLFCEELELTFSPVK